MLDSPYRLVALTVLGALLAGMGFTCDRFLVVDHSPVLLLFGFSCIPAGLIALHWSADALREGVLNERWPANRLTPLRSLVRHPAWKSSSFFLLALTIVAFIVERHNRSFFWAFFWLLQAQTKIGDAVVPNTKGTRSSIPLDWSTVPPLHSDHWGER